MEADTEQHFYGHGAHSGTSAADAAERTSCHWCQIRSFETHRTFPITIVNETYDGAVIPAHFRFIDSTVFGPGVSPAEDEFRSGCECQDDEDCMYTGCQCLEEILVSDEDAGDGPAEDGDEDQDESEEVRRWAAEHSGYAGLDGPRSGRADSRDTPASSAKTGGGSGGSAPARKRFAYHSRGAKAGMLRGKELDSREPIYECHEGCKCSKNCPNRVVERGRKVPLQIFRTETRGWGVRSTVDIKRGQFVDKYLGEIITSDEADRRRAASTIAQRKDVYLFALDKFSSAESLDPRLAGAPLEVDGEFMSGPTRFINHSCDPNMRIFARVGDHADKHIHDLALFAIKDIPRGDELTFDYVDGLEEMESDARDEGMQDEMTVCLCGSRKCRGFLW